MLLPILQGLAVAPGSPPSEPWQVGVGGQPSAAAEPSPTPAEQQEDAECAAEGQVISRAKQRGMPAARKDRAEERQRKSAPDSKSGSDMSLRVSVGHTSLDDSRTGPAAAPPVTAASVPVPIVPRVGKGGGSGGGGGGGKGSGFGKGSYRGGKGTGMHGGKGKGMRGGKGKGTHSQGGTGKGVMWRPLVTFSAAPASSNAIIAPTAVSAAAAAPAAASVPAPAPVANALTGPSAAATAPGPSGPVGTAPTAFSLKLLCCAFNGASCGLRWYQVADTRPGRGELLRTDAGQLPCISVGGAPLGTAAHQKVDLRIHARRPSGGESRFGPSPLELEPSSETDGSSWKKVTCGVPAELSLKIVSDLKQARQGKKGIGAQWRQRKKELEAAGDEELYRHPENPFAYELVVQAFRSDTLVPVSAELVLGPFEVFNNATSAVRCTPHAARSTPHAARYTPQHAARRTPYARSPARTALPLGTPFSSHLPCASTGESRLQLSCQAVDGRRGRARQRGQEAKAQFFSDRRRADRPHREGREEPIRAEVEGACLRACRHACLRPYRRACRIISHPREQAAAACAYHRHAYRASGRRQARSQQPFQQPEVTRPDAGLNV